jgi:hypothetical protein
MPKVSIARPAPSEHVAYYSKYINLVPDGDLLSLLDKQSRQTTKLLGGISPKKSQFRYAPDKWSIREVVGHISDTERVFAYRALTFARADATPLPSFDENAWARTSNAGDRSLGDLVKEFEAVRASTLALFRGFADEQFAKSGTANNNPITVRAIAYIVAGHERHHVNLLKERYGV